MKNSLNFWKRLSAVYACVKGPEIILEPPAWMQEAYRPQRIKYSIAVLSRGKGVPTLARGYLPQGTPSWPGQGVPYLGVPPLNLAGEVPTLTGGGGNYLGVPPSWPGRGCTYFGQGYLPWGTPSSGPGQGTPPPPQYGPGWGTPFPLVWTDWKHYLPHPSDEVGKNRDIGVTLHFSLLSFILHGQYLKSYAAGQNRCYLIQVDCTTNTWHNCTCGIINCENITLLSFSSAEALTQRKRNGQSVWMTSLIDTQSEVVSPLSKQSRCVNIIGPERV